MLFTLLIILFCLVSFAIALPNCHFILGVVGLIFVTVFLTIYFVVVERLKSFMGSIKWSIDKERKFQCVYDRLLKIDPLQAQRLLISRDLLYDVQDYHFWCALNQSVSLKKAIYQRRVRINRYVRSMRFTFEDCVRGAHSLYLVTLTFEDKVLARNEEKSLKRRCCEFMNSHCLDYIGCADYGKKNGRLHYHFICVIPHSNLTFVSRGKKSFLQFSDSWVYGFHNISVVNNLKRQFYYAMKLSNYCFKNENSDNKPFHKRGVEHWYGADDYEQKKLVRELNQPSLVRLPQDLRCQPKKQYNPPYCWVADNLVLTTPQAFTSRLTETTLQIS